MMAFSNSRRSLAASALLLSLLVQTCLAVNSMSAWLTSLGPQLIIQNTSTNGLMYSDCNSNNTPIFDLSSPKYFQLSYQPKPNSPVAGTGYYNTGADTKTSTSFWYLDVNNDIINSFQECNPATGEFQSMGVDTIISGNMPKPAQNTSLSAVLLGASAGYRLYYHDTDMNLQQVEYNPSIQEFLYGGVISYDNFSSGAVSAAYDTSGDVWVIGNTMANIEVAGPGPENLWSIVQFPEPLLEGITNATARSAFLPNTSAPINYTLPAFDGHANLGLSMNKDYTLNVFYIGTDRQMYQLYSWYGAWIFATNQSESAWPLADDSDAAFAIAYDQTSLDVRIYYFSDNKLMEIGYYNDATWHDAVPVQAYNTSAPVATPVATPVANPKSAVTAALSAGAKAGLGVGVSLGLLALISGGVAFFFIRRRKRRDAQGTDILRNEYAYGHLQTRAELDSAGIPTGMGAAPRGVHEMPVKTYSELGGRVAELSG